MIFGKIEYINLLPFEVFIKRYMRNSRLKAIIEYKKTYPAKLNKQLNMRKINAGFISSIASKKQKTLDVGIVAKKEVLSVLAIKGDYKKDQESATSNLLCKILGIEGKVLIGDKALYYYHNNSHQDIIDLAKAWQDKYNLPFVFARLSYNKDGEYLKNLSHMFVNKNIKIPRYILDKYTKKTNITQKQILEYLTHISYKIENKEKKALKKFFSLARKYQ